MRSFGFVPQPSGGGSSDTPETTLPCFLDRREDEEEQSEAAQRLTPPHVEATLTLSGHLGTVPGSRLTDPGPLAASDPHSFLSLPEVTITKCHE